MSELLSESFSQLDAALKAEEHDRALQLCDQILAAEPRDADALHAKVVSLIALSKPAEALQVIESNVSELSDACNFERAYCLYSLHREAEALPLLMPGGAAPESSRELQLAGQILYRQGDSARAAELFRASEGLGGVSSELSTNILAALVSAGKGEEALTYAQQTGSGADGGSSGDSSGATQFELFYNHACAAIAVNQLGLAKRLLGMAIEVCREDCADLTEEEIEVPPHLT
jgi:tetratricopeptide (TPR) repeat protein